MWPVSSARPLRRVSCSRSSVRRGGCQERGGTEFSAPPFFVCRSCGSSPAALRRFFGSFPAVLRRFFDSSSTFFRQFSDGSSVISRRRSCGFPAVSLRFSCGIPNPAGILLRLCAFPLCALAASLFPLALFSSSSFRLHSFHLRSCCLPLSARRAYPLRRAVRTPKRLSLRHFPSKILQ